jgi:hypothetical protein
VALAGSKQLLHRPLRNPQAPASLALIFFAIIIATLTVFILLLVILLALSLPSSSSP